MAGVVVRCHCYRALLRYWIESWMMSRNRKRKHSWPPDLKGPFPMQQLKDDADQLAMQAGRSDVYTRYLRELWEEETKRRVALIAQFFGRQWPQKEIEWLALIFQICKSCEAPGFKEQGRAAGAPEKWDFTKNRCLYADVMFVVAKTRRSELAAIKHIAENPTNFLNRYAEYAKKPKTLHRQFLRAKKEVEQMGFMFGNLSRAALIKFQIDNYSAEAYRKQEIGLRKN
jgi:hypothetical protein